MREIIEELRQERLIGLKGAYSLGINEDLFSNFYPDNAHFIYELLQNAEDVNATKACFSLGLTQLDFNHDGTPFSYENVNAITLAGSSTKLGEDNSIGKFGIGFKSVFSYTQTPEIHSGDWHFKIHDLFVPETEGVEQKRERNHETFFNFPFNHKKKQPSRAVQEIKDSLISLGDNVLLFLTHIYKIEYQLPDGSTSSLERIDHGNRKIEIRVTHLDGSVTISNWLRFEKDVSVWDEREEKKKDCHISIAYRLEENESKGAIQWKIIPIDGQVSIYFPAINENSKLRFHINAPFASTFARDSVSKENDANKILRDDLSKLIIESLFIIRDQKLLTVDFLAVLPNLEDRLHEFYTPIRDAVLKEFQEEKLTPTKSKSHASAKTLYRGPVSISDVLEDEGLAFFTKKAPPLWVANPQPQHQKEIDYFLNGLEINRWDINNLIRELSSVDLEKQKCIEEYLGNKDDTWMMRFYAMLNEELNKIRNFYYSYPYEYKDWKIVRVTTAQGVFLTKPKNSQFLPDEKINLPSDIYFVKKEVYDSGQSENLKISAHAFLEKIGVVSFDIKAAKEKAVLEAQNAADAQAAIELGIDVYRIPPKKFGKSHYEDLKKFIDYWKKDSVSAERLFNKLDFLLGEKDEGLYWCKPRDLCLASPYLETGLDQLVKIHGKYILSVHSLKIK